MQANIWVDDVLMDSGWKGSWNMELTGMYQLACPAHKQTSKHTKERLQKTAISQVNPGNF